MENAQKGSIYLGLLLVVVGAFSVGLVVEVLITDFVVAITVVRERVI